MIGMLMERCTIYGVLAAMCFAAGWKVNGWRLGERHRAGTGSGNKGCSSDRAETAGGCG